MRLNPAHAPISWSVFKMATFQQRFLFTLIRTGCNKSELTGLGRSRVDEERSLDKTHGASQAAARPRAHHQGTILVIVGSRGQHLVTWFRVYARLREKEIEGKS